MTGYQNWRVIDDAENEEWRDSMKNASDLVDRSVWTHERFSRDVSDSKQHRQSETDQVNRL